jgi:membrane-associated phospholipid phosphatase
MQEKKLKELAIHEMNFIPNTWDSKLAKWISDILSPPILSAFGIGFISMLLNIKFELVATYFLIVLVFPVTYIFYLVATNQVTDFHLRVRKERFKPYIAMISCAGIGTLYLFFAQAPYILIAMSIFSILLVVLMAMITIKWKISGHSATVASITMVIVWMLGASTWYIFLTVPLVAWARIRIKRHTLLQTIGGATLGFLFMGIMIFYLYSKCGGFYC